MLLIAKTLEGLEEILAGELEEIGAKKIKIGRRVVEFEGDNLLMYKANLLCRCAIRILVSIKQFTVYDERDLYDAISSIAWEDYMTKNDTLAVDAVVNSDNFNHSKYAAYKTKDAIVDRFREKFGSRPSIDLKNPTLRINIHIRGDVLTVSLDSSGDSLHRRGYRSMAGEAPINEVLAAGIVKLSGWDGKTTLLDPMCGSGTILIEATKIALGVPAFTPNRTFGFENWNNFKPDLWKKVKDYAYRKPPVELPIIQGVDLDPSVIKIAHENIAKAQLTGKIKFTVDDFEDYEPPASPGHIISNPPYELRIQTGDINTLYQMMGDQYKQKYGGWQAWIISSNREAFKHVRLKTSRKIILFNGPLECRLQRYDMYAGTKKFKKT